MKRKKLWIGLGLVVLLGAIAYANFGITRTSGVALTAEKIERHDLEAVVSASGKIRAKKTVNVSAETMGKVINLAVVEGQTVKKGQLLLEIDPRNLETQVQNREATLGSARSTLTQIKAQIENSKTALKQSQDTLRRQEDMFKSGLIPRETYERAQNDVRMRETDLRVSEQNITTQEQQLKVQEANLDSARYDLNKVRMASPIDGLVTKRNIEEGETAVTGTMNNAGTVLLVIADLSVIETEIEVDETDIPYVQVGQPASIEIDAFPDKKFPGKVTEVGNSPITTAGAAAGRATNFKVVVQIDGAVPDVRPGFTCTATVTTATRKKTLGVPIQAMTVRELVVDEKGEIVAPDTPARGTTPPSTRILAPVTLKPGQSRKEIEGVFVAKDGKAAFVPVKTGIAGEKYFEVLSGLKEGDEVITGPFATVRTLKEGDPVKVTVGPAGAVAPPPPTSGAGS
jgi:HlyD family secretion protein